MRLLLFLQVTILCDCYTLSLAPRLWRPKTHPRSLGSCTPTSSLTLQLLLRTAVVYREDMAQPLLSYKDVVLPQVQQRRLRLPNPPQRRARNYFTMCCVAVCIGLFVTSVALTCSHLQWKPTSTTSRIGLPRSLWQKTNSFIRWTMSTNSKGTGAHLKVDSHGTTLRRQRTHFRDAETSAPPIS